METRISTLIKSYTTIMTTEGLCLRVVVRIEILLLSTLLIPFFLIFIYRRRKVGRGERTKEQRLRNIELLKISHF